MGWQLANERLLLKLNGPKSPQWVKPILMKKGRKKGNRTLRRTQQRVLHPKWKKNGVGNPLLPPSLRVVAVLTSRPSAFTFNHESHRSPSLSNTLVSLLETTAQNPLLYRRRWLLGRRFRRQNRFSREGTRQSTTAFLAAIPTWPRMIGAETSSWTRALFFSISTNTFFTNSWNSRWFPTRIAWNSNFVLT